MGSTHSTTRKDAYQERVHHERLHRPAGKDDPPRYTPKTNRVQSPLLSSRLSVTCMPQWFWSNAQCKEWLGQMFIHYYSLDIAKARRIADVFEGFGPNLWRTTLLEWISWLGVRSGQSMFDLMMDMYRAKGMRKITMMPKHIKLQQYEEYDVGGENPFMDHDYVSKLGREKLMRHGRDITC